MSSAACFLARSYIPKNGLVYDIGASTGNMGKILQPTLMERQAKLIALDDEVNMIDRYSGAGEVIQANALDFEYQRFDVGILFLVLMFLPVSERQKLVIQLREKLNPGGALIIFDRRVAGSGYAATVIWRMIWDAKISAGVSYEEVMKKEMALSGIQRPLRAEELGDDIIEVFRFGDFTGWIIEKNSN